MAKRFIGIDLGDEQLRIAVCEREKGEIRPVLVRVLPLAGRDPAEVVREALGGQPAPWDQAAGALPASAAVVRRMELPFSDPSKIEAVAAIELQATLPAGTGEMVTDFLQPGEGEDGRWQVCTAGVEQGVLQQHLDRLAPLEIPVQVIDLWPYVLATVCDNGVVLHCGDDEDLVVLVEDGQVREMRFIPGGVLLAEADRCGLIHQQATLLERSQGRNMSPVWLVGPGVTMELADGLRILGRKAEVPPLRVGGEDVPAALIPAYYLALRAARRDRSGGFNFRRGPFASKSGWGGTRRRIVWAAALAGVSLLAVVASAYLGYAGKASRAGQLNEEMTRLFRQTFPEKTTVVDAYLQMNNEYALLEKRALLLGVGKTDGALDDFKIVSGAIPADHSVELRLFDATEEAMRLEGTASSFEGVNALAASLTRSGSFGEVRITDAKTGLAGGQIDFRIDVRLEEGGQK